MSLNVQVLGSTSSGNCTLVWDDHHALMIDCGFSTRHMTSCLDTLKTALPPLAGILITHSHFDHAGGTMIEHLTRKGTPVFCHEKVRGPLVDRYDAFRGASHHDRLHTFGNDPFSLGGFSIRSFEVPHDSPGGCFGFSIETAIASGPKKVTIATDVGFAEAESTGRMLDSDILILESNHDVEMLEKSGRPKWLINRIKKAHLSNRQCAELLCEVIERSARPPQAVLLAHLSKECNTHSLAESCTGTLLRENGHGAVPVHLTFERTPAELISLL
jgi:phosphoribosyl 1,2-cyclic phosphodiesterase